MPCRASLSKSQYIAQIAEEGCSQWPAVFAPGAALNGATDRKAAGKSFSKRPDQVQESTADASLMRVALAVIDAEEREALECDLKNLLASCE